MLWNCVIVLYPYSGNVVNRTIVVRSLTGSHQLIRNILWRGSSGGESRVGVCLPEQSMWAAQGRLVTPSPRERRRKQIAEYRRAFYAGELGIDEAYVREELNGFDFVCCWCREDEPCHADLHVEIVNAA